MNKENVQSTTDQFINFLINTPGSFLNDQLNRSVPETDDDYISMWTDYFHFLSEKIEIKVNIMKNLSFERISKHMPEIEHKIFEEISRRLEKNIESIRNKIKFKPRLERYLDEFPKAQRENIRKLLICLISGFRKNKFNDSITDIAESIGIERKWVLSLNDEHSLIENGVLEFGGLSIDEGKPLQEKNVKINFVAKKIFLGSKLSDSELYQIKHSPLIEMFELADEKFIQELIYDQDFEKTDEFNDPFEEFDDEGDDFDFEKFDDEGDDFDIENMIANLESDRVDKLANRDIPEDDLGSEEDELPGKDTQEEETLEKKESDIDIYKTDLEYLEQEFTWLKARAELIEKKNNTFVIDPNDDEKKVNELEQKTRRLKNLCEMRLKRSIQSGFTPRIITMQKKYRFSDFEINTIKAIITDKLFPTQHGFGFPEQTVGNVLMLLIDDMKDRVRAFKAFRKKSKLVRSNIIQLEKTSLGQDLFNCTIKMDTRMTEYLHGENFDIADYVDGGFLYRSRIQMDHMIMNNDEKKHLLRKVKHYPKLVDTIKKLKMSSTFEYGDAQVNLFVGPSGTGKTMLANALSNYLDKKILVFNLNNYSNITYFNDPDKNLFSLLFREARMNDAILFFDEAENLLQNRVNDLLIELENHHGIVVFATNATFAIDEALRRRINHIQHFKDPGPELRKKIWDVHLPKKVQVSNDLDLEKLAMRYEINGGLIKNAVFSSITHAVADSTEENDDEEIILRMKHLENGADEQLRNKLFMSKMEKQITPVKSFQDIILPEGTLKELNKIAKFDKSRKVLLGEWGFGDVFKNMTGKVVLFHGPPGTGKTLAAEALAYETGKNLKMVNYSQIMSKWVGETEKALEVMMKDVAEVDSILLFDEADGLFASRTDVSTVNDRYANMITNVLLSLTENFNSIAVLTTNYLQNIDPAFYRRMELVEFKMPDKKMRYELWRTLLPPKLPIADDVDFSYLADTFNFSGGDIKNAIIDAASESAVTLEGARKVSMNHFLMVCKNIQKQKIHSEREIGF